MSLTLGRGPFGQQPGSFNFSVPGHVVYVEDLLRRVRAVKAAATVVDSERPKLVHETGRLPHYSFPAGDVHVEAVEGAVDEPHAEGHLTLPWDAVDAWYEEDEQIFVHPHDPFHRIDVLGTSRRVRVELEGVELADSTRARALYETSLPVRYYLPVGDVRVQLLEVSPTVTQCAYKGTATHWSALIGDQVLADVAWTYEDAEPEADRVQGRICFYNERVDLEVDGVRQDRPRSPWSR
jgi:uncharacterized protein (DUF427 family)